MTLVIIDLILRVWCFLIIISHYHHHHHHRYHCLFLLPKQLLQYQSWSIVTDIINSKIIFCNLTRSAKWYGNFAYGSDCVIKNRPMPTCPVKGSLEWSEVFNNCFIPHPPPYPSHFSKGYINSNGAIKTFECYIFSQSFDLGEREYVEKTFRIPHASPAKLDGLVSEEHSPWSWEINYNIRRGVSCKLFGIPPPPPPCNIKTFRYAKRVHQACTWMDTLPLAHDMDTTNICSKR